MKWDKRENFRGAFVLLGLLCEMDPEVHRIYNTLSPHPKELLVQGRRFIREAPMMEYVAKDKKDKPRHLFLFNDVLLITKRKGSSKFWLRTYINLKATLQIEDVPDSTYKIPGVEFRIYAPVKTVFLFAATPQEKEGWIAELRSLTSESQAQQSPY